MALDGRIEGLVAVGASVAAGCVPCLRHHARAAQEAGASAEEIAAAAAVGRKVHQGAAARVDEAVAQLGGAGPAPSAGTPRPGCCG